MDPFDPAFDEGAFPFFDGAPPDPGERGGWAGAGADVSEDAIALRFTQDHGDTLRFDHDVGRWYQWQGTHWVPQIVPIAFHYAREIGRRLGGAKRSICKASVAAGAERFAQADPRHAVTADIWDRDPMLLATPAGTLDLRSGRMHRPRREDYITRVTGCAPERGTPERWLAFLDQATGGDRAMQVYLQRIAGYCLTGLTGEHALFFLYGPGGNGKSSFLNILLHILGDYALNAPMETFTSSRFAQHPTELAMLKGARLVTASETEQGRSWAEARIKNLTGGDPVTARFLHRDFFTYRPQFKLLFAGNHQPTLHNVDPAMQRRFYMTPFLHSPPTPDHALEDKLQEEAPRILAWALAGCLDWQQDGLARPASVSAATADYFANQDLVGQWIEECCVLGPREWEQPGILFNNWSAYARGAGEEAGTAKVFRMTLEKRGFHWSRSNGIRRHSGIALRARGAGPSAGPSAGSAA